VFGEADGVEAGHHADAGFAEAVFAATGAGGVGGHGGYVDDAQGAVVMVLSLLNHPACNGLGEEIGSFEIDGHDLVVAGFGGFEDVVALSRGHASVVDEEVASAEGVADLAGELLAVFGLADVAEAEDAAGAAGFDLLFGLGGGVVVLLAVGVQVVVVDGQGATLL